jgi:lipoate-protein ligase A
MMLLLSKSLQTHAENLAMDEALVEVADRLSHNASSEISIPEVLRLWEMPSKCVVLGRASKWQEEVNEEACSNDGVPVLRRVSGGASIVAGPGCLMYSVLISYQDRPTWRMLDVAHAQVMGRIRDGVQSALNALHVPAHVNLEGTCDLTINSRKFSGNALRCKRNWMLYHGTIMTTMPIQWLSMYLKEPPRQPEYRRNRIHESFVTSLHSNANSISEADFRMTLEIHLAKAWDVSQTLDEGPFWQMLLQESEALLESRYNNPTWHRSR